ncbi:MAG: hypothetical protein HYW48_07900 [Deltaproteobacteria bacterium]|nr:hypothetical protein [Deltaproteobacteria bacterium]
MYTISGLFPVRLGDHEFLQYARVVDKETGDERLLETHELNDTDPNAYSIGEGEAYQVSFAANTVEKTYGTYQFTSPED